jgi:hypothetical protein
MDPANAIVVKTFLKTVDAEFAAAQLRSHGIEYLITADDGGGAYPSLALIKLLVAPEQVEATRALLDRPESPADGAPLPREKEEPANVAPAVPPRVYRFNSGLVAGIIVGVLLHLSYSKYQAYRDGTVWYDRDDDGRADVWMHYESGRIVREESDENFDGRKDLWFTFADNGFATQSEQDTDHNGLRDVTALYTNGVLARTDWRPNGTNVVLLRQLSRHGVLRQELRDANGDGHFDVSIGFDTFNTPVATNTLHVPLRSLR